MGFLDLVTGISQEPHNRFTVIMGKPGSGKTTVAGTYPKPILYVSIDADGGGEVLKGYSDNDIKRLELKSDPVGTPGGKHIQTKVMMLLNELANPHPYKTVIFDAYSSIEEGLIKYLETAKGKRLSLDERGSVAQIMLDLRDKIINLSRGDVEYVAICHIKDKKTTDNTTGEETTMIIPKMSYNNGNILLERASNVMYCAKRAVINNDGTRKVSFLTYVGAHPNMDTKLRTSGTTMENGLYIENMSFDKLQELKKDTNKFEKLNVVETPTNPFDDDEEGDN